MAHWYLVDIIRSATYQLAAASFPGLPQRFYLLNSCYTALSMPARSPDDVDSITRVRPEMFIWQRLKSTNSPTNCFGLKLALAPFFVRLLVNFLRI